MDYGCLYHSYFPGFHDFQSGNARVLIYDLHAMRQRVLGVTCKTEGCSGIIPLPAARKVIFPSRETKISGKCRHCYKKNEYSDADVVDTGYEVIFSAQKGQAPPRK
jgi:hypothetical protein